MSSDNEYIQKLLSEARSGSQTSMGRLAVIARERLYPFVLRTTFNHDVTEDILQETLLAVVQQIASLRECQRFWPWVYRIAWSKIQDTLRRRRRLSFITRRRNISQSSRAITKIEIERFYAVGSGVQAVACLG